ncbi:MAG TPA: NUDIX hydrolase [Anaerolineaceae bacterium]|nr:NUDIX hydrolase [Anaerolineaceae bacterium]HPN52712.1 NUDIX hydrolase [Anaerolineaceae bacterium]
MNPASLRPWQTLSRQVILKPNKYLTVENHVIKLPDGQVIPDWPWIIIPSAAIVLPMTSDGHFLCFRQTKYAVNGPTLATVGGMLEPGEAPIEAARRELLEEMGCEAQEWVSLGNHILDPNRGIATMHLFLALKTVKVSEPVVDDLEDQERLSLSRQELQTALSANEFKVISWAAVVALALNYLSTKEKGG